MSLQKTLFPLLFLACAPTLRAQHSTGASEEATLGLVVSNVQQTGGRIWVGIYEGEDDYLDRERARLVYEMVDRRGAITINISELQAGKEYALAVFHDINDNGELDRNWLGLPSEPWGFSGEPRTRLRLPYFDEVKFVLQENQPAMVIRLRMY